MDALGEKVGLLESKRVVEEVEGLEWSGGRGSFRGGLSGIGAVESTEKIIESHSGFALVNHATEVGFIEGALGLIDLHVVVVGLEEVEARAAHGTVQFAGDGEDRIADGLGFHAPWRESPKEL